MIISNVEKVACFCDDLQIYYQVIEIPELTSETAINEI